jgi:hypothetical protein
MISAPTTDSCHSIDVRRWQRAGTLWPGSWRSWQWSRDGEVTASIQVRAEADRVVLAYRYREHGGDWEDIEEPVRLDTTDCHYGGSRTWFRCPAVGCGRRVAILYGAGRYFACRRCYGLAYSSQRENAGDRAMRRADNIRIRLGGEPGILNPFPDKPKWMRWRTYDRLQGQADELAERSLLAVAHHFKLFERGRI